MTNRKSQTIRRIRPASTIDVLPSPTPGRTCPSHPRNGAASASESRITNHESRISRSRIEHREPGIHAPATRKLSRNGKIARLAKPLRDMVNLMLQNNIQHSMIVEALEEHGVRVTKRNISNWKTRGGHHEWRLEQDRITTKRLRQDNLTDYLRAHDATQLPEVALQLAATQLCEFFLKAETEQQLATAPEKHARTLSNLCRVTRQIHLLQKYRDDSAKELGYRHNPERIKREIDKRLETTRDIYSAEKLGESINDHDISHRNFIPKNAHSFVAEDVFPQEHAGSPINPLTILSDMASAFKNRGPIQTPESSDPNSAR